MKIILTTEEALDMLRGYLSCKLDLPLDNELDIDIEDPRLPDDLSNYSDTDDLPF